MANKVIAVDVPYKHPLDGVAGGAITPGMLIVQSGGSWVAHNVDGGKTGFVADYLLEKSISDAYASGEFMKVIPVKTGDAINCLLTTSQTITEGDFLSSNGDGYLKAQDTGSYSFGGETNQLPIAPVGENVVHVAFIDPGANSADLSVSIDGNYISVSLATDGSGDITSTPALIKAAIEDVTGYSNLVSLGTVVGTGAVEADEAVLQADKVWGFADEDVTTTAAAKRIKVRKV